MASKGHPPSSHARFESVLQQVLKDFPHVDSLRKEQKDCIKNRFWEEMSSPFFAISAKTKLLAPEKPTKCELSRVLNGCEPFKTTTMNG